MTPARLLAFSACLCSVSILAAAQAPTFSSKVEVVTVDVLATEHDRLVPGLKPSDFVVRDNGVEQRVDFAILERLPLNVVLALDTSASVEGDRLEHLRDASRTLVDGLLDKDQAAVILFNEDARRAAGLTGDLTALRYAIATAKPSGDTAVVDASFAGLVVGESRPGRGLEIVFTDGQDVSSWLKPADVVEAARRSDVVVYTVRVGRMPGSDFLSDLSKVTGGRLIQLESTRDLKQTFVAILDEFRHRYLLSFTPRGPSSPGWHTLDVRVKGGGVTVHARPGYFKEK